MVAATFTDFNGPLAAFVSMQRHVLDALAAAWLAHGAHWVAIQTVKRETVVVWPGGTVPDHTGSMVSKPLYAGKQTAGMLCISVPHEDDTVVHARIQADAAMLSHLMDAEDDMEDMTVELIESQDRLLALYRLTRSLGGQIDLDTIMATFARKSVKLIQTQAAVMLLEDVTGWRLAAYPEGAVDFAAVLAAFQNMESGREGLMQTDIGTLYVLPVDLTDKTAAGLVLVDKAGGFTSPDLKLARAICDTAGVHLENARLHQESLRQAEINAQLDLAAKIQRQLLPAALPDVPGVKLYGRSMQARNVGGDFYDVHYHNGGILSFVVGDVTGKGFSAALLMAITRTVIRNRAELKLDWGEAGAVFTRANNDLYDDYSRVNMFTTAFIGRYDPETRLLCFSNAGHSPVIYCPAGGQARLLVANDIPLGILLDTPYNETILALQPGDMLVVGTDGFSEARNAKNEMFGYDALLALVTDYAPDGAQALGEKLFAAVRAFSDVHPQDDDQTLFIMQCK